MAAVTTVSAYPTNDVVRVDVLSAEQTLTATAAAVGDEMSVSGRQYLRYCIKIAEYNNSTDVRFQVLFGYEAGDCVFPGTVETVSGDAIALSAFDYYEEGSDSDKNLEIEIALNYTWKVVQLKAWAGTLGVSAGKIASVVAVLA